MKVIFFNGPPRSGKDTAAKLMEAQLIEQGHFPRRFKFAEALKNAAHAMVGLDVAPDHFEAVKDFPDTRLPVGAHGHHLSPRELYILVSEQMVKPAFGNAHWGKVLLNSIQDTTMRKATHILITDSGFVEETLPLVEAFGLDNCTHITMYREGCSFKNDSRSYWISDMKVLPILNNGSLSELDEVIKEYILERI
jgi:hypothetical protein